MAYFIVCIELRNGTAKDYDVLHAAMETAGFRRTITGGNGQVHELPAATYFADAAVTLQVVLDFADKAAARTGKRRKILVSEGSISWVGLDVLE